MVRNMRSGEDARVLRQVHRVTCDLLNFLCPALAPCYPRLVQCQEIPNIVGDDYLASRCCMEQNLNISQPEAPELLGRAGAPSAGA